MNKSPRIIFMGTPEFAAGCLRKLIENQYKIVGVVTVADKPAGRGKKIATSAVKKCAQLYRIPILQPKNLKDKFFLSKLSELKADLQVVVAFRMLPREVWKMPSLGTFNLHASLLPDYRGAAPINWAIINGEKKSGVTTFMIDEKIDTGEILLQEEVIITRNMTAGELHDNLLEVGAELILKTIDGIIHKKISPQPQPKNFQFKKAPKIFKQDCKINWEDPMEKIHYFIQGLSPYPGAWTRINLNGKVQQFKILASEMQPTAKQKSAGTLFIDKKQFKVAVKGGFIVILRGQLEGKKPQDAQNLINGIININTIQL